MGLRVQSPAPQDSAIRRACKASPKSGGVPAGQFRLRRSGDCSHWWDISPSWRARRDSGALTTDAPRRMHANAVGHRLDGQEPVEGKNPKVKVIGLRGLTPDLRSACAIILRDFTLRLFHIGCPTREGGIRLPAAEGD